MGKQQENSEAQQVRTPPTQFNLDGASAYLDTHADHDVVARKLQFQPRTAVSSSSSSLPPAIACGEAWVALLPMPRGARCGPGVCAVQSNTEPGSKGGIFVAGGWDGECV